MIIIAPRPAATLLYRCTPKWDGFVFSNETSGRYKYPDIKRGGDFLGVGSHQNFDHICRTLPDNAIIVDISETVPKHLEGMMAAIKLTKNPFEFWSFLGGIMSLDAAAKVQFGSDLEMDTKIRRSLFDTLSPMDHPPAISVEAEQFNRKFAHEKLCEEDLASLTEWMKSDPDNSPMIQRLFGQTYCKNARFYVDHAGKLDNIWLKSCAAFSFLRSLIISGNITVIQGDISDDRVLSEIRDRTTKITACYLSNAEECLPQTDDVVPFKQLFGMLPWDKNPLMLRSHFPLDNSGPEYEVSERI